MTIEPDRIPEQDEAAQLFAIAVKLAEVRKLTIEDLAEDLGTSRQTVANWIAGKTPVPAWAIIRTCALARRRFDKVVALLYEDDSEVGAVSAARAAAPRARRKAALSVIVGHLAVLALLAAMATGLLRGPEQWWRGVQVFVHQVATPPLTTAQASNPQADRLTDYGKISATASPVASPSPPAPSPTATHSPTASPGTHSPTPSASVSVSIGGGSPAGGSSPGPIPPVPSQPPMPPPAAQPSTTPPCYVPTWCTPGSGVRPSPGPTPAPTPTLPLQLPSPPPVR